MSLALSSDERAILGGERGEAPALALRIVAGTATMLGATRLLPIASVHVDGCLYHGDSGTLFAERLATAGGAVVVPTTLNVGALDLLHAGRVRLPPHEAAMARRMMAAYEALGCRPTWTCAPYQAGHRPSLGEDVAWGESNAVVFCNSVLGARTNRYGDYLDICAALCGRAPETGLHRPENRRATVVVEAGGLAAALLAEEAFYPVLGAWLGRTVGSAVAAITGLPSRTSEDRLKALGAAAASTGAVGLFHAVGLTPEAPDLTTACGGDTCPAPLVLTAAMLEPARRALSTVALRRGDPIDGVALGSPHFSFAEFEALLGRFAGRRARVPVHVCTGRHVVGALAEAGLARAVAAAGVTVVADTCIVVTPILAESGGVLMTNSGKFAHYTKPNTGWEVLYGSLADCVESAVAGRFVRDEALWA